MWCYSVNIYVFTAALFMYSWFKVELIFGVGFLNL